MIILYFKRIFKSLRRFFNISSLTGLFRVFSFREKLIVTLVSLCIIFGLGYWVNAVYHHFTIEVPDYGGKYQEGMIGQPVSVNPVLSSGNPADADLVRLIFSGLFKYGEDGRVIEDLADSWSVSEDGKEYTISLKKDLLWHDGESLSMEDVLFTYEIIQNPAYQISLRKRWPAGLKMEKLDDFNIKFILQEPFLGFLDVLTVGIIPKHIWDQVSFDRFSHSAYNIEPIGSGPYRYVSLQKSSKGDILSYTMKAFLEYHSGPPFIKEFTKFYYDSEETMIEGYGKKEIRGFRELSEEGKNSLGTAKKFLGEHEFLFPQYYVVFFNQTKSKPLSYNEVREALNLATDRNEIVADAMNGKGIAVQAPFLPGEGAYRDEMLQKSPDISKAESILESAGWIKGEDGVRVRNGDRLEFTLMTADWAEFVLSAEALKRQWERVGAQVHISVLDTYDLGQNHIRPREYEALLYVQAPDSGPNLFSYWHSSQREGSGLNLALFSNKTMDEVLEKTRIVTNREQLEELNRQFQDIFLEKNPGIYLFSPIRVYLADKDVLGISPRRVIEYSDRFGSVEKWYINTRREWKK